MLNWIEAIKTRPGLKAGEDSGWRAGGAAALYPGLDEVAELGAAGEGGGEDGEDQKKKRYRTRRMMRRIRKRR